MTTSSFVKLYLKSQAMNFKLELRLVEHLGNLQVVNATGEL